MNTPPSVSQLAVLRQRAMTSLGGVRAPDAERFNASEAMEVLYRLASSQSTAPDALALLHELQVHQVELDLQNEELVASRNALEGALLHQTYLFDHAPVGYLGIDANGVAHEVNRAALRLLGVSRQALQGRPLTALLTAPCRERLLMMMAQAQQGALPRTHALHFLLAAGVERVLHATADLDMSQTGFLLALMAPPDAA